VPFSCFFLLVVSGLHRAGKTVSGVERRHCVVALLNCLFAGGVDGESAEPSVRVQSCHLAGGGILSADLQVLFSVT
jgi:hypothetical protein